MSRRSVTYMMRRGDRLIFRMAIPTLLRSIARRSEIKLSLRTSDPNLGRQKSRRLANLFDGLFQEAHAMRNANIADVDGIVRQLFQRALDEAIEIVHEMPHAGTDILGQMGALEQRNDELQRYFERKLVPSDLEGRQQNVIDALTHAGLAVTHEMRRYVGVRLTEAEMAENAYYLHELSGKRISYQPSEPMFASMRPQQFPETAWSMPFCAPTQRDDQKPVETSKKTKLTVGEAVERYCRTKSGTEWVASTEQDNRRVLRLFVELSGSSRSVDDLNNELIREMRDLIERTPIRAAGLAARQQRSLLEFIREAKGMPTIAFKSKKKQLETVRAFLRWLVQDGYLATAPGEGIRIAGALKNAGKRDPYSTAELSVIFQSPLYQGSQSRLRRHLPGDYLPKDGHFWVPLIALFSGMRMGEIVQLQSRDLQVENDIWFFDINEHGEGKTVKTEAGARRVPMHPFLLSVGLLDHRQGKRGNDRLFDDLTVAADGSPSRVFSKWWGRYTDNIKIGEAGKVFHSFRHSFRDAMREADISPDVSHALMGHADQSVHGRYGAGPNLKKLAEAVRRIGYPQVQNDLQRHVV